MKPIQAFFALLALCLGVLLPRAALAQSCTGQNCGVTSSGQTCSCFDCEDRGPGSIPPICSTFPEPQMCPIRTQATAGPSLPILPGVITSCCFKPNTAQLTAACAAVGEQGSGLLGSPCGQVRDPNCNVVSGNGSVFPLNVFCPAPAGPICYAGTSCTLDSLPGCRWPLVCSNVTWGASGAPQVGTCIAQPGAKASAAPIPKSANMALFGLLAVLGVGLTGAATRKQRKV